MLQSFSSLPQAVKLMGNTVSGAVNCGGDVNELKVAACMLIRY